jgi:hypothetical protein
MSLNSATNTPLNLFLGQSSTASNTAEDADTRNELMNIKNYIIRQNTSLNESNKNLISENASLTLQLESKEDELDTMETQIRYIKNELKNFVELRELEQCITNLTIKKESKTKDISKEYRKLLLFSIVFICVYKIFNLITLFTFAYNDVFNLDNVILIDFVHLFSIFCLPECLMHKYSNFYSKIKTTKQCIETIVESVKVKKEEMKKIEDSNSFIVKYIDNL